MLTASFHKGNVMSDFMNWRKVSYISHHMRFDVNG